MFDQLLKAFDLFNGVPLHPLLSHFAIVGTLAISAVAIWAMLRGRRNLWRRLTTWSVLNLLVSLTVLVSGLALASRTGDAEISQTNHQFYGQITLAAAILQLIALIGLGWFDSRRRRRSLWIRTVLTILLWVVSLSAIGTTVVTTWTGTKAAWQAETSNRK